jgi:hypothetical protein
MITDQNAEVSDTTGVDSSAEVGNKKIRQHIFIKHIGAIQQL